MEDGDADGWWTGTRAWCHRLVGAEEIGPKALPKI